MCEPVMHCLSMVMVVVCGGDQLDVEYQSTRYSVWPKTHAEEQGPSRVGGTDHVFISQLFCIFTQVTIFTLINYTLRYHFRRSTAFIDQCHCTTCMTLEILTFLAIPLLTLINVVLYCQTGTLTGGTLTLVPCLATNCAFYALNDPSCLNPGLRYIRQSRDQ